MKKINLFKTIVFASTLGMALSAWGDYTIDIGTSSIPTNKEESIFKFSDITYEKWKDLKSYKDVKFAESNSDQFRTFFNSNSTQKDMSAYLRINAPVLSSYMKNNKIISKYQNNLTGSNKDYIMFQVPNYPYLAFIITASQNSTFKNIENDKDNLILKEQGLQNISIKRTNANDLVIKTLSTDKLNINLYISLVVIPDGQMQTGVTNINEEVGTLTFYEAEQNSIKKREISLKIQVRLDISLPSCTLSTSNLQINMGKVSKEVIEQDKAMEQTASFDLNCPTPDITKIYAKVYDFNYPTNLDQNGDLQLKCGPGVTTAKGVKVRVKLNGKAVKLGDNALFNPKFNLQTGNIIANPSLLDLGTNKGTNKINVSTRYVKDKTINKITSGCANAKMGIIFNYD